MKAKSVKPKKVPDTVRKIAEAGIEPERSSDLLIAAIGASAGGLEAGIDLVRNLIPGSGMAYVFIQHLDPSHHSIIRDLLAKETSMPVTEVTEGVKVVANHVYVIPPNKGMTIEDHTLRLSPRDASRGVHMPIDHFMRALAEELGNRAIGVILSGTGSDGVLGMAEIQARGGVTFAQDPATAKYDGMPRSAIAAGRVDYVLPPHEVAGELARLAQHPYVSPSLSPDLPVLAQSDNGGINMLFQLLRRTTRVDFTHYRKTTILRRIQRRMLVYKIDKFADYVKYVQTNPAEVTALYQDMLIHVTSFFRNPKVFEALKQTVFPQILEKKGDSSIRVWVPGCASGEEAYSLAIALLEFLGSRAAEISIQLFGTDISETSIRSARAGIYPANIQGDVSPERIRRFFAKAEDGYRINKNIREMCIFAQHNLLSDPPFSRMDLICCRNLLIYFEPVLQVRVTSLFNYALRSGGYLVLGTSEGISAARNLFKIEDRENRIFAKKASSGRQMVTFSLNRPTEHATGDAAPNSRPQPPEAGWNSPEAQRDFDRRLLLHYVPPAVFVNEDLEIIHTRGKFDRYFKVPSGRPSLNVLKMALDELTLPLRSAIAAAGKEMRPVRRKGIAVSMTSGEKGGDAEQIVSFEVIPLKSTLSETCFMIVFLEEAPSWSRGKGAGAGSPAKQPKGSWSKKIKRLEQELATAKEHLRSVIENQEVMNEELQSANEEILSSNEELQSTNEELETAKEELQSTNEELSTVNDELRGRNIHITGGRQDLRDLLTDVSIVVVGSDLRMRPSTPPTRRLFDLLPEGISAQVVDKDHSPDIPDLTELIQQALSGGGVPVEQVVEHAGKKYRVRVLPYGVAGKKADGCIVTLMDASLAARLSNKPQPSPE